MMPMSGSMTAMSVAPTPTVRNAASVGSTLSMRPSRRTIESSKNVSDRLASTVSKLPERVPTTSMRA